MKSILACLVALLLALTLALPVAVFAQELVDTESAKAVLLTPLQSNVAIVAQNEDKALPVAGLAKLPAILTLALAFDEGIIAPDASMQVSKKASGIPGPTAFLDAGETAQAEALLKAAVMISAGDAIWTLGENAFGSEQVFLQNIQVVLQRLGLDLALTDCLGGGTLFTARDLLALGQAAAGSQSFLRFATRYMDELKHADGRQTELVNANRLVRFYAGCFGLLTGSAREEGYSGVFAVTKNEVSYVAVVIGASSSEDRFTAATRLFDYAYANCKQRALATAYEPLLKDYPVLYGDSNTVNLVPHETVVSLLQKQDGELGCTYELPETLLAPLAPSTGVGRAVYAYPNSAPLYVVELFPEFEVMSFGFMDILMRFFHDFMVG
ncbi:MAG: hypothetical protein FWE69_02490 [Clostridiales bacterium]|nr:hypothetical protein [Clostridiales bacterium]